MEVNYIDPKDIEVGRCFERRLSRFYHRKGIYSTNNYQPRYEISCWRSTISSGKATGNIYPYIMRQTDDELDLRECEYIENAFRKDLEWQERNAIVSRIHDLMKEKYGDKWTIRRMAELVGRSAGGIMRCLQMHTECQKFPVLANLKTEDEAVKLLRKAKEKMASKILADEHKERTAAYFEGTDKEEVNPKVQAAMYADSHFNIGDAFIGMQEMLDNKLNPPISFVEVDIRIDISSCFAAANRRPPATNLISWLIVIG